MKSEFYIGYLPKMPDSIKRVVRSAAALLFSVAIGLGIVFALSQQPFAKSFFEFGNVRAFEGTIQSEAIPFLLVEKEERVEGLPAFERYPLVGEGKHGVDREIEGLDGKRVKLKGTLIYRDEISMIEVASGSVSATEPKKVEPGSGASDIKKPAVVTKNLGIMTLRGEIIDSKCYLGVMNPGNTKVHRDCAVACLRGGVPAMFVVKDGSGNKSELWLVSQHGQAVNEFVLDYVAEPVELRGEVIREGDFLFFIINPTEIKRLG